jgi:hypothetical protein
MDRPFGRGIIEELFTSLETGDRAGIDDRAAGVEMGNGCFRHIEISIDIGAKGCITSEWQRGEKSSKAEEKQVEKREEQA